MVTGSSSSVRSSTSPAVRAERAAAVGPGAVEQLALGPLLRGELRGAEVVGAGQRPDVGRQRRRVVRVAAAHEDRAASSPRGCSPGRGSRRCARRWRPRSRPRPGPAPRRARPPSSGGARARGGTSGCRSRGRPRRATPSASRFSGERRVLADDEEGDPQVVASRARSSARGTSDVEVRRERLPAVVAVGLHVRPQVVEVERQARDGLPRGFMLSTSASARRGIVLTHIRQSVRAARSASSTVSLTFSVPFTICAELTRCSPGTLVAIGGTRSE